MDCPSTENERRGYYDLEPASLVDWRNQFEAQRAWLAGLIDGEGCFEGGHYGNVTKGIAGTSTVAIVITNTSLELLGEVLDVVGGGIITAKVSENGKHPNRHDTYYWRLRVMGELKTLIEWVYPYLVIKKRQARLMYHFASSVTERRATGRINEPLSVEEKARRREIVSLIQRANKREQFDVPSWCIEVPRV